MPLKIIRDDITQLVCDAIVCPTDEQLSHTDGVDAAVHAAAGEARSLACAKRPSLSVGQACATEVYRRPCRFVIHTVGPRWKGGQNGEEELLRSCYRESLRLCEQLGCESVAFPLISAGAFGFPRERVLRAAMEVLRVELQRSERMIYLVIYDAQAYSIDARHERILTLRMCARMKQEQEVSYRALRPKACDIPPVEAKDRRAARRESDDTPPVEAPLDGAVELCHSACASLAPQDADLEDMLRNIDRGFADTLFSFIDGRGITDVECYKRSNIDKKTFSKIKCQKDYRPSKRTVISFAIGLRLSLEETRQLLNTVGLSLSRSSSFDIIIEYFVTTGRYADIFEVNEVLYRFDQPTLGV